MRGKIRQFNGIILKSRHKYSKSILAGPFRNRFYRLMLVTEEPNSPFSIKFPSTSTPRKLLPMKILSIGLRPTLLLVI